MVRKRSVVVQDHKTSVSLESPFWESLKEIASLRQTTVADLVNGIENKRQDTEQVTNLSSAIRLFVLGALFVQARRLTFHRIHARKPPINAPGSLTGPLNIVSICDAPLLRSVRTNQAGRIFRLKCLIAASGLTLTAATVNANIQVLDHDLFAPASSRCFLAGRRELAMSTNISAGSYARGKHVYCPSSSPHKWCDLPSANNPAKPRPQTKKRVAP
jgi:predicted DNA-binding ribbon-helix-helix protein